MPTMKQISELFKTETNVNIVKLLSEQSMSLTELFNEIDNVKSREGVFKALQRLTRTGLVKRKFDKKLGGHKYYLDFKVIQVSSTMKIIVKP